MIEVIDGVVSSLAISTFIYLSLYFVHTYIHESVVNTRLDAVVQLVRALHRNRRAVGSISSRMTVVAFFATAAD
jgi:hypothetical protein